MSRKIGCIFSTNRALVRGYWIEKYDSDDYGVTDGIGGQDGYPTKLAAQYALALACGGYTYVQPELAQAAVDAGWRPS